MKSAQFFLILILYTFCVSALKSNCDLKNFRKYSLVPKIINRTLELPLKVEFNDQVINCGNTVKRELVEFPPSVNFTSERTKLYLLLMIDPDAYTPQNPSIAPFLHWLIINIPGNQVERGKTVFYYRRPNPPYYSDPHRYVILVYQQPGEIKDVPDDYTDRKKFDVKNFEKSQQLKGPIAGNFFFVGSE